MAHPQVETALRNIREFYDARALQFLEKIVDSRKEK